MSEKYTHSHLNTIEKETANNIRLTLPFKFDMDSCVRVCVCVCIAEIISTNWVFNGIFFGTRAFPCYCKNFTHTYQAPHFPIYFNSLRGKWDQIDAAMCKHTLYIIIPIRSCILTFGSTQRQFGFVFSLGFTVIIMLRENTQE